MRSIAWWHFQWPWRTPNPGFKVTAFLKSNIGKTARLKEKVTIAQQETTPNIWNGTMFGDLDWPLNASRWFVGISWAFCCVALMPQCAFPDYPLQNFQFTIFIRVHSRNWGPYTVSKSFCIFKRIGLMFVTRNSAVADKPRDAFHNCGRISFVQTQWRGWPKTRLSSLCYHAEFGRSTLKCVDVNIGEPSKMGSPGTSLSWDVKRG